MLDNKRGVLQLIGCLLQMKLAVILLSCLVGLSYQQNYGLWTPSLGHRAALYQNLDADQFIRPSVLQPFDSQVRSSI